MKKQLLFILLALLVPVVGLADVWQDPQTKVNYEYTPGGDVASVKAGDYFSEAGSPDVTGDITILSTFTINDATYSVTSIGSYAFFRRSSLTNVTIPNSVTNIEESAFYQCTGLTSITIPNSVTCIESGAFLGCGNLEKIVVESGNTVYDSRDNCNAIIVTATNELIRGCKATVIPGSVTCIGYHAFDDCTGLTSVTIPNSVTNIEEGAFDGCTGLTSVTIPNSVTSIESYTFKDCRSLTNVTIPNSVTSIESYAFSGCRSLTNVTIPNSVTGIGHYAFASCSGLTFVTIGNSVTTIGMKAFSNCSGLTSVTIPNSVTTIGQQAFDYCTCLTSVTIGNNVTSIGKLAFYFCHGLTSLTIPKSITSIGEHAFYQCWSLKSITSMIMIPFEIYEVFDKSTTEYDATLYVPVGTSVYYQATAGWKDFKNIVELEMFTTISLNVTDEQGTNLTEKANIVWYDADGRQIGTGKSLYGVKDSTTVYYSILLDEKLGRIYREVKKQKVVVDKEDETMTCKLQCIEEVALHGAVQAYGMAIPRAEASLTQWLNGKYEYTAETKTDANGEFILAAYNDSTVLFITADGYTDETITRKMLGTDGELGTVEMQQVRGKVVALQLSYQETVREGEESLAQNWYSDTRNIDYSVRNLTKETDITDFALQQGDIVLPTGADQGDLIRVTLKSMNDKFAEVSGEGMIGENDMASIALQLKAYGGIEVYCHQKADEQISFMLYDSEGKLIDSNVTSSLRTTFTGMKAGSYTLVAIGYNNNVGTIGNLSDFDLFGLSEGSDYVKTTVTISDGIIGSVAINDVPEIDISKFEYTAANTSYLPNKTQMTVNGSFVTLTARVDFKTQYANEVSDVKLLIDIPEGCEFIPNSVVSGSKPLFHSLNGNLLTITLNSEDIDSRIRFCIMPKQPGLFTSTAYADFNCYGEKRQSIGLAVFEATAGSIVVPTVTASKTIPVTGIAVSHASVDIYDNDHLIGTTTALGDGKWRTEVDLYQPYNLSMHKINAKYQTDNGIKVTTTSQGCIYDINVVKVKTVTMINTAHRATLDLCEFVTVFDFESQTTSARLYNYWPEYPDFTFVADLTANDTTTVSGVNFYIHTSTNETRKLKGFFDETLGRWVAVSKFGAYNLPVNLGIEVLTNIDGKEVLADRQFIEDGELMIEETFSNRQNEIQKFSDILSEKDVELENGALYDELELLLSEDDYDEAVVFSIINQILSAIPDLEEEMTDEDIEKMEANFNNEQKVFEDWFASRMTTGRKELFESAMMDIDLLKAGLPTVPYAGTAIIDGTLYEHLADNVYSVNEEELISQGYVVINITDESRLFCRATDISFSYIDEKAMVIHTFNFAEALEARSIKKEPLAENFRQAFQNIFQNIRVGANYSRNYNDWLNLSVSISQLFGLLEKTYATIYDVVESRINDAFKVDELDSKIAAESERLKEWSSCLEKKKVNGKVKLMDVVHQKQIRLNLAILRKERDAILKAYDMAIVPLRQYPKRISPNVARMNDVIRTVGRVAGAFSVFADIIDLVADVRDLNDEIRGWGIARMTAENKRPCENDREKLQSIIDNMQVDFVDMLGAYSAVILGKVATTGLDIAQIPTINPTAANPLVELGLYVGSVYTGLVTEVYKVVRINNGEFVNRKSRHWTAIQNLKCYKKDEEEKPEQNPESDNNRPSISNDNERNIQESQSDDVTPMHDPSGFVYEAVPTNRVEGVTATIYFDEEHPTQWDAADFSQVNPQITDDTGLYQWDVPQGMWQVRFEKEGYETTQTDWLPVPPPQLEINIPMSEAVAPTVVKARGTESGITLDFSKYMKPTTLEKNGRVSVTVNGKSASGDVEMMNLEEDPYNQKEYASKVKFVPNKAFSTTDEVIITVKKEVESYASKQMEADFVQRVKIEPELTTIMCDSLFVVDYRDAKTLKVQVLPASASKGKTLQVVSTSPMIASTDQLEVVLDQDGKAEIEVSGSLPGSAAIKLSIPEADMARYVDVSVAVKETVVKMPKASKRSGSIVEPGYQLTLTCSTPGATIYYTLDGICPCDEQKRIKYTGPITLPLGHITLKAVAVREGMDDSDIVTYEYDVQKGGESGVLTTKENRDIEVCYQDGSIVISGAKGSDCHIYDLQGRELASRSKLSNHTRINVPKNDVYIVSVSYGNGQKVVCKVMRQ